MRLAPHRLPGQSQTAGLNRTRKKRVEDTHMPLRIGLLSIALVLVCTSVESAEWKFIGPSGAGGKEYYGFYDELTTERRIIGHVSAWVKLLSRRDRKSTRLNSSHRTSSYAVF